MSENVSISILDDIEDITVGINNMQIDVDNDWDMFNNDMENIIDSIHEEKDENKLEIDKCSELYISTRTVIAYIKTEGLINLQELFWKLPVINYNCHEIGIIKKQIKITSSTEEEVKDIDEKLSKEKICSSQIMSNVKSDTKRKNLKHVQKINIGICRKDIVSRRMKKKGAFYNCFVIILRIFEDDIFKEINVKVFNTGKLEIPGIQKDSTLFITLDEVIKLIQPYFNYKLSWSNEHIENVLINSNFNCGYCINREKLYYILRHKYDLVSVYDPCSYPGIQCKFYYNPNKSIQNGRCDCEMKCGKKKTNKNKNICIECSFMIFRTGSVLIVGHCGEEILKIIYEFLKNIFNQHVLEIYHGKREKKKVSSKQKKIKKTIICYT